MSGVAEYKPKVKDEWDAYALYGVTVVLFAAAIFHHPLGIGTAMFSGIAAICWTVWSWKRKGRRAQLLFGLVMLAIVAVIFVVAFFGGYVAAKP